MMLILIQAFIEVSSYSLGSKASLKARLTHDEFEKSIYKAVGLELSKEEVETI